MAGIFSPWGNKCHLVPRHSLTGVLVAVRERAVAMGQGQGDQMNKYRSEGQTQEMGKTKHPMSPERLQGALGVSTWAQVAQAPLWK